MRIVTAAVIVFSIAVVVFFFRSTLFSKVTSTSSVVKQPDTTSDVSVLFLHHSTGRIIWEAGVKECIENRKDSGTTHIFITEQAFPKSKPYGWDNYPYDYWNIWVNNAGNSPYKGEPTLEMITPHYDMVIWKHCFPVGLTKEDIGQPDVTSSEKRIENYKRQYDALKKKMHEFPETRFLIWTPTVLVKSKMSKAQAERLADFVDWIINTWNEKGDNIYLWDFYSLETGNEKYMKNEYAKTESDSHPNEFFAKMASGLLCNRIIDVLHNDGKNTTLTGR